MSNNPVQVVLDPSNYQKVPDNSPPAGFHKEYFADRDREFSIHKSSLMKQVQSIEANLTQSQFGQLGFVKVRLRPAGWAKTNRPVHKLFSRNRFRIVGGQGLGEIFIEVTPPQLTEARERISLAEEYTNWVDTPDGKKKPKPSRIRSEVGAIEAVEMVEPSDKRKFSVDDAIRWLLDPRTSHMYLIELFLAPGQLETQHEKKLIDTLAQGLQRLSGGMDLVFAGADQDGRKAFFGLRLHTGAPLKAPPDLSGHSQISVDGGSVAVFDPDLERHKSLLAFLDAHPLVKRVILPPIISRADTSSSPTGGTVTLPTRDARSRYPKVGIIDGGVSEFLGSWRVGEHDPLAAEHKDLNHGSFIAGLLVGARAAGNGSDVAPENDGCDVFDIAVFPDENNVGQFKSYYPSGLIGFLDEIDTGIAAAKAEGVRVFNMSINAQTPAALDSYSFFASKLDEIAARHDIVLVLSAGNLRQNYRPAWPADPKAALAMLAARSHPETICPPAECTSALSVGALNPPGVSAYVPGTPASYTRRGPGLRIGVKPDLGHYGGAVPLKASDHHGLYSTSPSGEQITGMGTSYSAPLVAKTVAALEAKIDGHFRREALMAMTVHHATMPEPMAAKALEQVASQFLGFGLPASASEMLLTEDGEITLVFADNLMPKRELVFDFSWPRCLVDPSTGQCRGKAKLTLVYRPPIEVAYGAEFARINLDAHLRQEKSDGHFIGRLKPIYLNKTTDRKVDEKERIEHGLKWWPTKVYGNQFPRGVGASSQWQLIVEALAREGESVPQSGIPFAVVLTIGALKEDGHVFNELRQSLTAAGVKVEDVRTALRPKPRA